VLAVLPPQLASVIQAKQDEFKAQATAAIQAKKEELQSHLPPQVVSLIQSNLPLSTQEAVSPSPQDAVISFEPTPVAEVTHVSIKSEDVEAFKAFLAQKADDIKNVTAQPPN
jgi:hypothetical protein